MNPKTKKYLYISIALFIYLVIISFPTYLFTSDMDVIKGVELGLRSGYLIFIVLFSIFTRIAKTYTGKTRFTNLFLLLPLFFIAFINLFYLGVVSDSSTGNPVQAVFEQDWNNSYDIMKFVTTIVTVAEEELLFRYIIQRNLTIGHKIFRILTTAAIFAICHFFSMLYNARGSFAEPLFFLEIFFVFGIGIILGFLYEYTNNIFVPIAFNLIYSICNQMFFKVPLDLMATKYYITTAIFAACGAAYLTIFYFLMLKKENR